MSKRSRKSYCKKKAVADLIETLYRFKVSKTTIHTKSWNGEYRFYNPIHLYIKRMYDQWVIPVKRK